MTQYRYIITRPCLLEGTLTIAKYLRPLFPSELYGQPLNMRDEQGRDYAVRLSAAGSRVTGMGALYHAMNLSVNDVLMLERVGSSEYRVQGVAKPYSRPQPTESYGNKPSELPARRVVIEASPHVREIRLEREPPVRAEPLDGKVEVRRSDEALTPPALTPPAARAQALPATRIEVRHEARAEGEGAWAARIVAERPTEKDWMAERQALERQSRRRESRPDEGRELNLGRVEATRTPSAVTPSTITPSTVTPSTVIPSGVSHAASGTVPRAERVEEAPIRAELLNRDPDRQAARRVQGHQAAGSQGIDNARPAARLPDILTGQSAAGQGGVVPSQPATVQPIASQPISQAAAPTSRASAETLRAQLGQLAELVGYRLENLGSPGHEAAPVRLRAELGAQSYDVMLALTEADMQHPAFKQGTYHALMTWEVDTASGAPRFTREALVALLENARLAPLTPLELRPYWNTASFDLSSVASVAELVSAYLAQRGTFTYVLSTLAQQSAHSVVDPQRLAEKLGSGVNGAELRVVLDTLSRPPFMALLPLQGGQYYLRAEVGTILHDLSQYASGVARRLQPPTRAGAAAVTVQS